MQFSIWMSLCVELSAPCILSFLVRLALAFALLVWRVIRLLQPFRMTGLAITGVERFAVNGRLRAPNVTGVLFRPRMAVIARLANLQMMTTLRRFVALIVHRGGEAQMLRIHARRIVATVDYLGSSAVNLLRQLGQVVLEHVGDAVGTLAFRAPPQLSVSFVRSGRFPPPAVVGAANFYLAPETLGIGIGRLVFAVSHQ